MQRSDFETHFESYREHLRQEIHRFIDTASVFRQIQERTGDYLAELNLAPGFFRTVEKSLFTTVILWADKLLDEQGQCGLFNFLTFVEHNRKWLTTTELQRRKSYPDGHWMIEGREPITLSTIEAHRAQIRHLQALPSFRTRRDKYHGHFDRGYFFDRSRLDNEAPLNWSDLTETGDLMGRILNDYSADYDGVVHSWQMLGIDDLTYLLAAARRGTPRAVG